MAFLYETHLHTKEGSACGVSSGREYAKRYLDMGYTGIIITDHFFGGNCRPSRNLPWEKWVQDFCRGYEIAREEGERLGLDVFFGWEETIDGIDYLVYGLDKDWLLEHPEASNWTQKDQYREVKRYGGCVIQAHPFRSVNHAKQMYACDKYIDAIEAANSGNNQFSDAIAMIYAQKKSFPITAGSDIHHVRDICDDFVFGVYLDKKMETIADYVDAVLNNSIAGLKVPDERFDITGPFSALY